MAERALVLGGIHLHMLFEIPVNESATPHRIAELALLSLYKKPMALYILQTIDVLCIDELGQVSAQFISVLDIIMRRVRNSNQYMGGVLVIATMDPRQLRPVQGLPAMLSPFMITCYKFVQLLHSVRASEDVNFQRLQDISRMLVTAYKRDANLVTEFRQLVRDNCVFITDWNDSRITMAMLQVFGRHAAVREAEGRLFEKVRRLGNCQVLTCAARDYQMSVQSHSGWTAATLETTRFLNRKVKEPDEIHFFDGAVYEMTFNDKDNFTQSQIAVLAAMPTADDISQFRDVKVMIAPAGCKTVPENYRDIMCLREQGWKHCTVGLAPERIQTVRSKGLKAKRHQYGLKHRVASTVHAIMGAELDKLVTSVSKRNREYGLWEKEQVVVILSRTKRAKDIIFVGDTNDTLDALCELIQINSQYSDYMAHILDQLCDGQRQLPFPVIDYGRHPYRPIDVEKPQDSTGFCYLLVSMKNLETTYIGQTFYLVKRLKEHNTGHGSRQTVSPMLRPWALLGFVCGFDRDKNLMLSFERRWKDLRDATVRRNGPQSPSQIGDLAKDVISTMRGQYFSYELRYVQCATLHHRGY
jgi:predicted GIY-YIG superfamily endonuclease